MLAHRILVANAVLGGSLISVVRKFLLRWGDLRVSHESHDLLSLNTCWSLGSSGHDVLLDGSGVLVALELLDHELAALIDLILEA